MNFLAPTGRLPRWILLASGLFGILLLANGLRLIGQGSGLLLAVTEVLLGALTLAGVRQVIISQPKLSHDQVQAMPPTSERREMFAEDDRRTVFQGVVWLLAGAAVLVQGLAAGGILLLVAGLAFLGTTYLGIGMLLVTFLARRRRGGRSRRS